MKRSHKHTNNPHGGIETALSECEHRGGCSKMPREPLPTAEPQAMQTTTSSLNLPHPCCPQIPMKTFSGENDRAAVKKNMQGGLHTNIFHDDNALSSSLTFSAGAVARALGIMYRFLRMLM